MGQIGPSELSGSLSRATAQRLSQYLRCLRPALTGTTVSSSQLARAVGVSDAQVRRDLATLGNLGQRGIGYDANALTIVIRRTLGIDRTWKSVIVGVGNLARALLRYRGFHEQGFEIVGLFDSDPHKIGTQVDGLTINSLDRLVNSIKTTKAELGVIAVPPESAQLVADELTRAGIKGLLNFAPALLKIAPHIRLVTVDLAIQFEQLAYLVRLSRTSENGD